MKLQDYINKINNNDMFSFSRWGDGEWNALLGVNGQNCDRHKYFPDMGKRLAEVLSCSPEYILGLQPLATQLLAKPIDAYTKRYNLTWVNSDVFHNANIDGTISNFFECLQNKNILLVGPKHLREYAGKQNWKFYEVPAVDCWLKHDIILQELYDIIENDSIVLFCASMMTNVIIDELHGKGTLIDFGSVLDPYVGVKSRSYHHRLNLK